MTTDVIKKSFEMRILILQVKNLKKTWTKIYLKMFVNKNSTMPPIGIGLITKITTKKVEESEFQSNI